MNASRAKRPLLIGFALLAIGLVTAVYFRPLTVFALARDVYLRAIGMQSRFVEIGPHRIHYLTGGEGPPLLMVHGVASRAADAAPILRPLMKHRRIYALDLLGYGESDKPADADYSVAMQTDIVRRFAEAMEISQGDVIGISMGGWVALKYAAERPERVRRLVLVSSAGLAFPSSLHERSFSAETLGELRESLSLQTDRAGMIPDFILRDLLRQSRKRSWIVRRSMRSMFAGTDLLDGRLAAVRMPVLLVWGTSDRIVPVSLAARMREEMPHATLAPLTGCGHLAIVECRREAIPPIVEFLAASPGDDR
jgi:pimeloyl-ACP methyl ester carboxylesterase